MRSRIVPPEAVRPRVDPARFEFETTATLPTLAMGEATVRLQPRARAAVELAMATRPRGGHVFASGRPHLGKIEAVLALLRAGAAELAPVDDWAYVFSEPRPDQPAPLRLPPGQGPRFAQAVNDALDVVRRELPRVVRSGRFRKRQAELDERADTAARHLLDELKGRLRVLHFTVRQQEGQLEATPLVRGRPVTRALSKLPRAQREAIETALPEVSTLVEDTNRLLAEAAAGFDAQHDALHREAAHEVVTRAFERVRRDLAGATDVQAHLNRLVEALVEHHDVFLAAPAVPAPGQPKEDALRRFRVHVLVTHAAKQGVPVVLEGNPSFATLFGTLAREVEQGALVTDFTHLRPGALHRANGGFLVLPARALLAHDTLWDTLKRALRSRELRLELDEEAAAQPTAQLVNPQPMPLEATLVLTGEAELFEALHEEDPDFRELFTVRADFDDTAALDAATLTGATHVVAAMAHRDALAPFDAPGVARVLEAGLRLSGDQQRLSLEWDRLRVLVREAHHHARLAGDDRVRAEHVRRAEEASVWRSSLRREQLLDDLRRGLLHVQVADEAVGHVNALALSPLGDCVVGRPVRVSARVGPGSRGLVDIERQALLGGPVHSKAVLQLQGYLVGRFARRVPLAIEATLSFEQSYGPVEGDSASVAELLAILSALAEVPVQQRFAVTCSLGQDGTAQAVGGVTEKVEAFFDACHTLGLDGTQGVVLSAANVQHLVLRDEVVEAIRHGRFHLHAIEHVDEALELLTGLPPATVDARVAQRMETFTHAMRRLVTPVAPG